MERKYESMVIVRPDLTPQDRDEVIAKISQKVDDLKGKVEGSRVWAENRRLTFTLKSRGAKKEKFDTGSYILFDFNLDTEKLSDLKEMLRLEERVLRNVIIRISKD